MGGKGQQKENRPVQEKEQQQQQKGEEQTAARSDWQDREHGEHIRRQIVRLYDFINDLETAATGKLHQLNSRLKSIEQQLDLLDFQISSANKQREKFTSECQLENMLLQDVKSGEY
eukprot:TRINITY_DN1610_c0_g2_i3.p1 TRINITY_DN1610_c0_g2~~TRINITY_DN1610_c0_g2_i3.p1  ORF type:complete len:116 (+),score=35.51 TRINITY_DN1610_c0_g2_i3:285-632(+)